MVCPSHTDSINDQQEQLNHMLEAAKEELEQVKHDILSMVECSIPRKSLPIASTFSTADLFPHMPACTSDGLAQCSRNSDATEANTSTESKGTTQSSFPVIIEEHEFNLDPKMPALPSESGAVTHGAKGPLPSHCMAGKQPEQKVGSPLKAGKALTYIMENYCRLEKAALGLDQSSNSYSPSTLRDRDHNTNMNATCHKIRTNDGVNNANSESPYLVKTQPMAIHQ